MIASTLDNLSPAETVRPVEFPEDAQFALLTVQNLDGFRPGGAQCGLPSMLRSPRGGLSIELVSLINSSTWSRESGKWAVAADNGSLHMISITAAERPGQPNALPTISEPWYGEKAAAAAEASRRNAERLAVSIVPREWTIVVRNLRHPRFLGSLSGLAVPTELVDLLPELPPSVGLKPGRKAGQFVLSLRGDSVSTGDGDVRRELVKLLEDAAEEILNASCRLQRLIELTDGLRAGQEALATA